MKLRIDMSEVESWWLTRHDGRQYFNIELRPGVDPATVLRDTPPENLTQ